MSTQSNNIAHLRPPLGVIAALESEARLLIGPGRWQNLPHGLALRKELLPGGSMLLVVRCGAGHQRAAAAAEWLISQGAAAIINPGLAGGLSPELAPGQLVIPDSVYELNNKRLCGPFYNNQPQVIHTLELTRTHGIAAHGGALVTSPKPVLRKEHKAALFQNSQALAVDMESSAILHKAHQAGVACIIIRAICDPARCSVPRALFDILDEKGRLNWLSLMGHLVRNPLLIRNLIIAGRHFAAARRSLQQCWQTLHKADYWRYLLESAQR